MAPPSGAANRAPSRRDGWLLFGLLWFCYAYVHQPPGWNQDSRLDLVHALVREGRVCIDTFHQNTGDKSVHQGHYYSEKPPGIALLAVPAFCVALGLLHWTGISPDSAVGWRISSWISTAGSVGWVTALGGVALYAFLSRLVGRRTAYLTVLAVFLGSLPFPYATMLFSHGAVIGLLCIALWAIGDEVFWARHAPGLALRTQGAESLSGSEGTVGTVGAGGASTRTGHGAVGSARWLGRHVLAGLCCGWAIASEYTAALAAGAVLVLALLTGLRRGLVLAAGAVPALLLIPWYNWACFGSPLAFGYHHLALPQFQEMNKGLFGITFPPRPWAAYLILFSPERGLLTWSPFFVLMFVGLKPLWNQARSLALAAYYLVLLQVFFIAGYYMPDGGSALGPRHLAPMLPLASLVAAAGLAKWPRVGLVLACASILLNGLGTVVNAMPPRNMPDLLLGYYGPWLMRGHLTDNLGLLLRIPPGWSLAPLLAAIGVALLRLPAVTAGRAGLSGPAHPRPARGSEPA